MQSFDKNIIPKGCLYVVATPIGHLGDITYRAVQILSQVDWIAAEDTRHTRKLLQHYGISTKMVSYHQFNERVKSGALLDRLRCGEVGGLVSDAGTPLLSDPGYVVVTAALDAGITVVPVPGPSACIAALSVAGLSSNRFVFEGFLTGRTGERRRRLTALARETRTLIFYEAPHRIAMLLQELNDTMGGERFVVIARELTKIHESIYRGTVAELLAALGGDPNRTRGEMVVMIEGISQSTEVDEQAQHVIQVLCRSLPTGEALKLASQITDIPKNILYQWHLDHPETSF